MTLVNSTAASRRSFIRLLTERIARKSDATSSAVAAPTETPCATPPEIEPRCGSSSSGGGGEAANTTSELCRPSCHSDAAALPSSGTASRDARAPCSGCDGVKKDEALRRGGGGLDGLWSSAYDQKYSSSRLTGSGGSGGGGGGGGARGGGGMEGK